MVLRCYRTILELLISNLKINCIHNNNRTQNKYEKKLQKRQEKRGKTVVSRK